MFIRLLPFLVLMLVIGFVGCVLVPRKWERMIFSIAMAAILAELAVFLVFGCQWLCAGLSPVSSTIGVLYTSHHYTFSLDLYFDGFAAVFLGVAVVMATLVFLFSRYYMHREQGFKRFYCTIFLFLIGMSLVTLAGNFEVLFLGWELIGISSVLLIAFYRERFLPARNALKVFSVYRIADAFLLAAVWYAHHFFGRNVRFAELSTLVTQHGNHIAILGLLVLGAALIKSAQFPFSYWLPRAMEGPTTSSAIFYGALSVHMGLFLLVRTYPLWEGSLWLRTSIATLGLVTALVAATITRVQSSTKTQIAYASITQIGIMFIELAAGLQRLALIHFVSNAFLRTYQLLISPSAVSYLIHDQFFSCVPPPQKIKSTFFGKLRATFYIMGIKEWNMNSAVSRYVWRPLKCIGRTCAFLDRPPAQAISLILFLASVKLAASATVPASVRLTGSTVAALISIMFYIRAYTTKSSARTCWNLIMLGHLFGMLFLASASEWDWTLLSMYSAGVVLAFIVGSLCLWYLQVKGEQNTLRDYHGSMYAFAKLGHLFFIVSLLFMAFPISPSFLAQDIFVSLIPSSHAYEVALFLLSYVLEGVGIMRLYIKVFFGPHTASYHEVAYKSS